MSPESRNTLQLSSTVLSKSPIGVSSYTVNLVEKLPNPFYKSLKKVAVGMIVTYHPPPRSVRAELPHTALPSDGDTIPFIRILMIYLWLR